MAIQEFKCPNCGGAIQFNPGIQELTCPFCESVIDADAFVQYDEDSKQNKEPETPKWDYEGDGWSEGERLGMAVYSCKSCGGEIIGDETLGATTCPFCDSPIVVTSKFDGKLRPDVVIPFKIDKEAALAALQKHYMGKRLLPAVFKDRNHLDEVKGVYIPFWLYDANADAHIEYSATKTRSWSDSRYDYHETSYYRVIREGCIGFDSVPVDGSKAVDNKLTESIEPFDTSEAADFQSTYLAGYFANRYDVDSNESSVRANERIKNSTESEFRNTVNGYSSVTTTNTSIRLRSGRVRYALLPVWMLGTSWDGQSFLFAMNGQSGKFVGDLPLDKKAYWLWFLKIFGIAAGAALLISQIILTVI